MINMWHNHPDRLETPIISHILTYDFDCHCTRATRRLGSYCVGVHWYGNKYANCKSRHHVQKLLSESERILGLQLLCCAWVTARDRTLSWTRLWEWERIAPVQMIPRYARQGGSGLKMSELLGLVPPTSFVIRFFVVVVGWKRYAWMNYGFSPVSQT